MPRSYRSTVREERAQLTRAAVVRAGRELFVGEGWVATTMAKVADRAGVARQTVYLLFDSKLTLLDACIDDALREGTGVPVREQPSFRAMGEGSFARRVAAGAAWLRAAHERSARIQRVLDEAAVTDPAAAIRLAERERTRWEEVRFALGLVLAREPADEVVDSVWTLASRDQWLRLTARGWTGERWEAWFARHLTPYR